ncbi:MAG TPA: lipid II flippase MurJ, partial [Mycobacteriales bacterium]|nr:lipid II flippase MurJ [Mycobacteriales bacterium]
TARTLRVLLVVAAAAAAMMCAAAGPAARVLVLGAPGSVPPEQLARALVTFAPGLIGYALVALLSRALYAQGDARTPAAATVVGWLIAIGADIALVAALPRSWAVAAIGIGTSIGMTVAGAWLLLVIRRSGGATTVAGAGRAGTAALAAAAAAIAGGVAVARALPSGGPAHSVATAVIAGAIALLIHAVVVGALDRPTVGLLVDRVRAGLRRV